MVSPIRLSSVCNACAQPVLSGIFLRRHLVPWPSADTTENFTQIVPGEPLRPGEVKARGVAKYSDFGPIEGYISKTAQLRAR